MRTWSLFKCFGLAAALSLCLGCGKPLLRTLGHPPIKVTLRILPESPDTCRLLATSNDEYLFIGVFDITGSLYAFGPAVFRHQSSGWVEIKDETIDLRFCKVSVYNNVEKVTEE